MLADFKKEFNKLNPEQKSAAETIDGPVMVVAGPGTGKTQILTLRIANILAKTDASPENILALTFTEAAAANMRRRLVNLIGTSGYYINIHTFHGFCNKLIQDYPENFPKIIGANVASPADQIAIIRNIIDTTKLKHLKPFGNKYYYTAEILKNIHQLKNEGFDSSSFKKQAGSPKNLELALVYQKYQAELAVQKLYDFEDMILETIKSLKENKDFLLDLQEKHQYVLVDEHQDTNGAQNKTLELLASYDTNPNLFVVGDEKQAIFRFQGASLENFLYFKKKFPQAKLVELKQNYRSHQNILDASHSLIEKNTAVLALTKLRSDLPGRSDLKGRIKIGTFETPETEYSFIAQKIKELLKQKVAASEITILYRENKDAASISDILSRQNITHRVESDENILEDIEIKKLNILMAAIQNFGSDEHLFKALHLDFLGVDPLALYKIPNNDISRLNLDMVKKLGKWKKLSFNTTFPKFFEMVLNESGYLKSLLSRPNYHDKLAKLNTLFGEVKKLAADNHDYDLPGYLNYLEILKEHNLPIRSKTAIRSDSVRLMTAHKAKGLEFDYVFIAGAYNGHWGNKRNIKHFDLPIKTSFDVSKLEKNEDERRLLYMALTRARKGVFITYATASADGREQVPSQFIGEIKSDLKEEINTKTTLANQSLLTSRFNLDKPETDEKALVKELFLKRGLSPTSLNNYLDCPWNFFYNNLLRMPKAQANYLIYGNAKHKALQLFFDAREKNKKIGAKFITEKFIEDLKKYPLKPADYQLLMQKGVSSLTAYYNYYKNSWPPKMINEYIIKGINMLLAKNQAIKLSGKLDKLELQPNGSDAIVVDYKTGPIKSRNEILGAIKTSNGNYFRQLVFYKLLLDSLPKKKYRMDFGVIDFTEPYFAKASQGKPDDKNRFRKEVFEISDTDVKDLKSTIARTADEILNLKFWNKRCGRKECEYCELRKIMPHDQL